MTLFSNLLMERPSY